MTPGTKDGSPRFARLEHDERRASILWHARRLFCERPYQDVKMSEIADAAGVARGLLHHYFGAKRDLYIEVLTQLMTVPTLPLPDGSDELPVDEVWAASVDGWMQLIESNKEIWLTAIAAGSTGRDAQLDAVLNEARELVAERSLEALRLADDPSPELRALVRGFGGFAEEVTREWLERERLTRAQAYELLLGALPLIVERLLPALRAAGEG